MDMWDNTQEEILGDIWAALAPESDAVSASEIQLKTGIPTIKIYSALSKMKEVGIMQIADKVQDKWLSHKNMDAMSYARAVEIGIPLYALEKTVTLSVTTKKEAESLAISGELDIDRKKRDASKARKRTKHIRGRAASRAATTDLARIVGDAQKALNSPDKKSGVHEEFRKQATAALDALITAMEKK